MDQMDYYVEDGHEEIADQLPVGSKICLKRGNSQRGAAAQFQAARYRLPEDCAAVIKEYKRVIEPQTRKTMDPIFEQWKTEMANRSFSRYMDAPRVSESRVHWLIDPKATVGILLAIMCKPAIRTIFYLSILVLKSLGY